MTGGNATEGAGACLFGPNAIPLGTGVGADGLVADLRRALPLPLEGVASIGVGGGGVVDGNKAAAAAWAAC